MADRSYVDLADIVQHVVAQVPAGTVTVRAAPQEAPTSGDPATQEERQMTSSPEHGPPDDRNSAWAEARRWVRRKRIFATIVAIYLSLSLMWFVIDMLDDSTGLWFYWPMLGTGLAVVVTGIGMFGLGGLFGADWERRQVDKYLQRHSDRRSGPDAWS